MQVQTLRILVALMLTLVVMMYFHTTKEKEFYSKSAEPAVAQILTQISDWKKQSLMLQLAHEAKEQVSDEQLENLLELYRAFGRYRSIEELEFSRTVSAFSLIGEKHINYSGTANFDAGLVSLNITLVERGGFFQIYNFALAKKG